MSEEQELVYKGIAVGHYSIAFSQVQYTETEKDGTLSLFFAGGQYLNLVGDDAETFYKAYRAYLGYLPEVDEEEELPF
jgi:hypothetical protein